ncbi:MAG: ATP-binding protein [Desulfobacterium sp.]|nr:ATP-binding protein [Desulfobacterium sp.]
MKRIFITLYILIIAAFACIIFGVFPVLEKVYKDAYIIQTREEIKGTFSLVMERLEGLSPGEQQQEIDRLQPRFGFPLGLVPLNQAEVADKDLEAFKNGVIVEGGEDQEMAVQRIGTSDWALLMDPFIEDELDTRATRLFFILCLLLIALPALVWSFFLQRDLKKIGKASAAFGQGDHSARVRLSAISTMAFIGDAFNQMAHKTEVLIRSQKDLANSVSHEIRTPLSRIKFSLEMMAGPAPARRDYPAEISKDVEEIESLVDEMLTYARFDREPVKKGELPHQEILSWLFTVVDLEKRNMAPGKTLTLIPLPAKETLLAEFEPRYLEWVIRNLVRNALRHGKERIEVAIEEKGNTLVIHVDDDGPGIPKAQHESVFKPFMRLDQSRNRMSGGYGLGLAIAQRITLWHRGRLEITQSPLKGARFTLVLPLPSSG